MSRMPDNGKEGIRVWFVNHPNTTITNSEFARHLRNEYGVTVDANAVSSWLSGMRFKLAELKHSCADRWVAGLTGLQWVSDNTHKHVPGGPVLGPSGVMGPGYKPKRRVKRSEQVSLPFTDLVIGTTAELLGTTDDGREVWRTDTGKIRIMRVDA